MSLGYFLYSRVPHTRCLRVGILTFSDFSLDSLTECRVVAVFRFDPKLENSGKLGKLGTLREPACARRNRSTASINRSQRNSDHSLLIT